MATTLTKLLVHIAFSTKHRAPLIPVELERDLFAYTGAICRRLGSPLLNMNGTEDHVHLLVSLGKAIALSDLLLEVKRDTSKLMKEKGAVGFAWQEGYFGFSLGESGVDALHAYIAGQKEHHRARSFQDEMREFLAKYKIEYEERYVWD